MLAQPARVGGLLAPGAAASSDLASRGKIYTFRIVE
jgi:hypothetical protein